MTSKTLTVLEIRALTTEWEESLVEFFKELTSRGIDKIFHPHPFTREEAHCRTSYTGKDLYYLIVEGRKIIGYGMLRGWDEGFEVPSLGIAIHPNYQNLGAGRVFMQFLHLCARRAGAHRIRLKYHPDNARVRAFYESLGYVFAGEERGQFVGYLDLRERV